MYEIEVKARFDSSHFYDGVGGPERSLHGHTFLVSVVYLAKDVNELGMVALDRDLIKMTTKVISELDNRVLNDMDVFEELSPTLENISALIFHSLKSVVPAWISVASVAVSVRGDYSVKYVDKLTT